MPKLRSEATEIQGSAVPPSIHPVVLIAWVATRTPSQEDAEQTFARQTIETCWEDQKTKSYEPSKARFVAGVCEKMERDFRAKYGRNP